MGKEKRMTIWKKLWKKIKNICAHLFAHNKKTCKVCNYKELKKTPLGRVKIEYFELAEKNTKLREFIGSEVYNALRLLIFIVLFLVIVLSLFNLNSNLKV